MKTKKKITNESAFQLTLVPGAQGEAFRQEKIFLNLDTKCKKVLEKKTKKPQCFLTIISPIISILHFRLSAATPLQYCPGG